VSGGKPLSSTTDKRLPYNPPTVTKLTSEEAQAALESRVTPGDEQAEKLREVVKPELE
jgi:hypothetical protein